MWFMPLHDNGNLKITDFPGFVDPDNGNYRLKLDSICVDMGHNDFAGGEYDLCGNPRVLLETVDIGAHELTRWFVANWGWDGHDGLAGDRPKETIQAAADAARPGNFILVPQGEYTPFETGKAVHIVGLDGAGQTFINGHGRRCATMGPETMLIGFTLQHGRADHGGGAFGGTLERCILRHNNANSMFYWGTSGGGAHSSRLINCLLYDNEAQVGGGAANSELIHCTVTQNRAWQGGGVHWSWVQNSIVWGNGWHNDNHVDSTLLYSCTTPAAPGDGNIAANPNFTEGFRLHYTSPCLKRGSVHPMARDKDLAGDPRVSYFDLVDMGAYESMSWGPLDLVQLAVSSVPVNESGFSNPPPGVYEIVLGLKFTASVAPEYHGEWDSQFGISLPQYQCVGWTGTGDIPASGSTNEVTFMPAQNSSITWVWTTNQWLSVTVYGEGSVDKPTGWYPLSSTQTVTATPAPGYVFSHWTHNASANNTASVLMDGPRELWAHFVPQETQSAPRPVPYGWLDEFYPGQKGNYEAFVTTRDPGNGYFIWELYVIDFDDPGDPANRFYADITFEKGKPVVKWNPDRGAARDYALLGKPKLDALEEWIETDPDDTREDLHFFKVKVDLPGYRDVEK